MDSSRESTSRSPAPGPWRAAWAAGIVLAALAVRSLWAALPRVPNRGAFAWDSARRALLDLDAADHLHPLDPPRFLWALVGPETWPTLRLAIAAPLHAVFGADRAFAVEHGLSIACFAAVAVGLALLARAVAGGPREGLLVLAVAAAALAGNGALLAHAANGMLEPLGAALTAAALAAWIAARERGAARPVALALAGNALFHVKWQYGIFLAVAVVALEGADGGLAAVRRRAAAGLRALAAGTRTPAGAALAASAGLLTSLAAAVGATGGFELVLAGQRVTARDAHGPLAWAALLAFAAVERAVWRERRELAEAFPQRLRFAWTWLVTPMAAWLLVPFTWRLRTLLVTAGAYRSGEAPETLAGRLLFYPRAAWESWTAPGAAGLTALLVLASAVAAWRSPELRRRLAPVAALASVELLALVAGSRRNFQARFALDLAPVLAVAAAAWLAPIWRPPRLRAPAAAVALAALVLAAWPRWQPDALAGAMARGFDPAAYGEACRQAALALTGRPGALINGAPPSHVQGCALWAVAVARERRAPLVLELEPPRAARAAVVLFDCARPAAPPAGFSADGEPFRDAPLCGQRYARHSPAAGR
ncbi:MAG TPA: hypothetical protein VEM76_14865 [Anaeromyxobacteraceae bacterium]|nr:hypothetical protein [Anaeromyxobacteraceae bacterium]